MDSGATHYIKDANVLRLQQLQNAADQAFTAHVTRHKAEIARRHSYFQEKFAILGKDIRKNTPSEALKIENDEDCSDLTAEIKPQEAMSTDVPQEHASLHIDPVPEIKRRELSEERRRLRKFGRQRMIKRATPPTIPAQSKEAPQENMKKPPPSSQDSIENRAAEELKVLMEIEKFEKMMNQVRTASGPPHISAPEPPMVAAPASPPKTKKRSLDKISFKNLFDLSPQFRDIETDDEEV